MIRAGRRKDPSTPPTAPTTPVEPPAQKRRPCTARIWLSPTGYLVVQFPFDQPMVDFLRALPPPRRWDSADQVWRVMPEHLDAVRAALEERFEIVEVHPDAIPFIERRARAVRREAVAKVVRDATRADGEAVVLDLASVRTRRAGGGA